MMTELVKSVEHFRPRRLWRGQSKMQPGAGGEHAPARGALDKPALKQEGFDHVFDRVARFGERGGDGFNADRAAAKMLRNQTKITPVKRIKAELVDLEAL